MEHLAGRAVSDATYKKHGCRCEGCAAEHAAGQRTWYRNRMQGVASPNTCGQRGCHNEAQYESVKTSIRYCRECAADLCAYVVFRPIEQYESHASLTLIRGAG